MGLRDDRADRLLAYFDVHISARILGITLLCEVLTLAVFDIFIFSKAGGNVSAGAINPVNAFKSLPGRALPRDGDRRGGRGDRHLLRVLVVGRLRDGAQLRRGIARTQEERPARPLHLGDRSRDLLHAHLVGRDQRLPLARRGRWVAQNNSANFFFVPARHYGGVFLKGCLSWFIITGSFACGMAFHNTTARYMYSLGREKVLPRRSDGRTPSTRARTSRRASQSVIAALILLAFVLFAPSTHKLGAADSVGYLQVYGLMAVMGVVAILFIQALCSLAIFNYFRPHHAADHHWWKTITAPILATISQCSSSTSRSTTSASSAPATATPSGCVGRRPDRRHRSRLRLLAEVATTARSTRRSAA